MSRRDVRVLQVAASDVTIAKLLLPLINNLTANGYEVESACADGRFAQDLNSKGYVVHTLPMSRSISPWKTIKAVWALYRLLRKEKYDIVHVHTPVAAGVGRLAAKLAGTPTVIYTAHGFYFHDLMKPWAKRATILFERVLGRFTHMLFTQSTEDAQAAVHYKIAPQQRVVWISNGVDINRFSPREDNSAVRARFGLKDGELAVGFVGRLVREKGILELLEAMRQASERIPNLVLLIAGDNKTGGDRDVETQAIVQEYLSSVELPFRVEFTGFIDDVEEVMQALDVFVLPSYREGMPRTIIEAMASGKPVIASDIRGCREEVSHGITGLLVPVRDAEALGKAIVDVLNSPDLARSMGEKGRGRAEQYFDEQMVIDRQLWHYARLVSERHPALASRNLDPVHLQKKSTQEDHTQ